MSIGSSNVAGGEHRELDLKMGSRKGSRWNEGLQQPEGHWLFQEWRVHTPVSKNGGC